jgi:HK97 family phage prohead protease
VSEVTIYGRAIDPVGLTRGGRRHGTEIRASAWRYDTSELRSRQPRGEVNIAHTHGTVGRVAAIERSRDGSVFVVAEADLPPWVLDTEPWYWSVETDSRADHTDLVVTGMGLVTRPAVGRQIGPVEFFAGGLNARGSWVVREPVKSRLERAYGNVVRPGSTIALHDETTQGLVGLSLDDPRVWDALTTRTAGPIEIRSAPEPVDVSLAQRLIELIVMPYERPALVEHKGRMIEEVCSPGAFDGIQRQGNRVRVNRDHKRERTVGKALAFFPDSPEGLVAQVKVARTPLGDETLALAEDGCLDASAGFGVKPNGERWETRDRRRLTSLYLDHIALTPDPAYVDANVLAVRGGLTVR